MKKSKQILAFYYLKDYINFVHRKLFLIETVEVNYFIQRIILLVKQRYNLAHSCTFSIK